MKRRRRGRRRLLLAAGAGFVAVVAIVLGVTGVFNHVLKELTLPLRHEDIIRQQAREKDVDASLIAAVIYAESRFRDQTSQAGARGLMQITPTTAKEIERLSGGTTFRLEDLSDPDINIRYGTFYLAELLRRFDGNEVAALAAYHAGPTAVERWGGSSLTVEEIPIRRNPRLCRRGARQAPGLPSGIRRRSWDIERSGRIRGERAQARRSDCAAVAVGLVLADSSVVVLALPNIYRDLDTSVAGVTWVLVSFNIVMACAAVPAAHVARRAGPGGLRPSDSPSSPAPALPAAPRPSSAP